jgi:tryptophan-rich sensory protein
LTALAAFVVLCLIVGICASFPVAMNVHNWYLTLKPPPLNPPNWLFAPVWAVLYVMMGVAAWLVWRQPDVQSRHHKALTVWGWQLALNALWTPVFFGLHLLLAAFAVICALFAMVAVTIFRCIPLNKGAVLLLAPYLAWVGFASYLNGGYWWLNH